MPSVAIARSVTVAIARSVTQKAPFGGRVGDRGSFWFVGRLSRPTRLAGTFEKGFLSARCAPGPAVRAIDGPTQYRLFVSNVSVKRSTEDLTRFRPAIAARLRQTLPEPPRRGHRRGENPVLA
jgi:hypothetical protein